MILSVLITVLSFVGLLLVLVLVHEWGHFFAARRFGVKVHEFGFGFPPKIKGWMRGGTEYTLNWIPLGGFVRLKGEDGGNVHDTDSFAHKPAWKRLVILLAGVLMNFILGYVLFVIVFAVGTDMPVDAAGQGAVLSSQRVSVADVLVKSPAQTAGIEPGDEIVSVNGITLTHASSVHDIVSKDAAHVVAVVGKHAGVMYTKQIMPAQITPEVVGLGVEVVDIAHVRYPFPRVLAIAGRQTGEMATLIFKTLGTVVGKLVRHGQLEQGVAGPVGIAVITGQVVRTGIIPFLQLAALLSINLGVLNVLPFPALDGGRALFVILEKIVRKKVRSEIEQVLHFVGFALLMLLVLAITYRDIVGLIK